MSRFEPTPAQREAIDSRGCAMLVSAGAGSGKTRVLTERVMHAICDGEAPADLDTFLIISFTRAAAGELRGRIMEELAARIAADPGNLRLRRQNALCQRAQIGTIHSFCANLLREYCQKAELSPDFKIIDDERAGDLRAAVLDRVLEKRYESMDNDPGFRLLVDTVGEGRDDSRLSGLILTLHARMQCHARPEDWAEGQIRQLYAPAADAGQTPWGQELLQWAAGQTAFWSEEFDRLMALMQGEEKISAAYLDSFSQTAAALRELKRRLALGWEKTREALPVDFPKLKTLRASPDPALSEYLKARREACKDSMKKIAEALAEPSEVLLGDMAQTAPAMEALLRLTLEFDREYAKDKRARALVDYADLEHMTVQLLTDGAGAPTELARQLSRRYTEIMVDEYQDVSQVQDLIFRAVSDGGRNLFLVGDVKQSIYRFRLADAGIFNEKYERFAQADPQVARRVLLRENFRSRREILNGANAVFSLCMSKTLGDVEYNDEAALICGAKNYEGPVPKPRLLLLELPRSAGEESPDKTALEAAFTARRIKALVESGATVTTPAGERPMEYGDVAILLRSVNQQGGVYRRALMEAGVPVGAAQGSGFFATLEVSAVLAMLAVMDNPHKDIPLIAVLRSAALGFTPDELARIRAADREADFYTALVKAAQTDGKCRAFVDKLSALRAAAADLSAAETVWLIIEELDMLALCAAMEDGQQRRANLLALLELAEGFESTGYRGLHRLSLWLQVLAEKGQEPATGGGFASAVQILSIHKSKGLEFPVVFLCDTARRFNASDRQEAVLVHPELGLGPKVVDLENRVQYPSLARVAIARRLEREDLSEEMRLLYVALTRAKERLYVTAALREPAKALEKVQAEISVPMPPELLLRCGSMAAWMLRAVAADGGANWALELCAAEENAPETAERPEKPAADPETAAELERRLAFRYPHAAAVELPSKITATELKGHYERDEDAEPLLKPTATSFRMPELGQGERPLTAAERGVATHLVLQYMDFSKGGSRRGIQREIDRLCAARFLSPREAEAVNVAAIERLFASPLGRRMLADPSPLREFRFSLLMEADTLYPDAAAEQLLLQGVVDCCIEEEGKLVVIDYKTDNVRTEEQLQARAQLYRGQLMAYAAALERIFRKPVKECTLFFLSVGRAVTLARE
ncbi:MAG: helicase-exonuclease AddAB subunit AddA [Oscillospiraceae bacterium]|nr:helicase-exonuclease AddAB subunit AddA [Oscillospiraceae bacterium]